MEADRFGAPIVLNVESIGGIDETAVTLEPGVNVLTGRNATNRTSFLQAIMAALGSDRSSLKGDAETGSVELTIGEECYHRSLVRQNGHVSFDGDPFLEGPELADLFAFLLESNDARRAVSYAGDLRELIMRPVDTEQLQAEIESLEAEKRELDDRIETLSRVETRLPELESERVSLQDDLETLTEQIESLEAAIENHELDVEESRSQRSALEEAFTELREARQQLESIEYDLQTERESLSELEREREELETELESGAAEEHESVGALEERIAELRERKRSLDTTATELQSVIQFNESQLEDGVAFESSLSPEADETGEVTDQLLEDDANTVCWTCGSTVDRSCIESTLERLRTLHQEALTERKSVQETIETLSRRRSEIESLERERKRLERRHEEIDGEIEHQRQQIEALEERRHEQRARVETLETKTDSFEEADYSDVLALHRQRNELELERTQLREERATVDDRIDSLEAEVAERDDLLERREAVEEALVERRTRADRIERDAVDAFNEHIESLLSLLEYKNIERIWIERRVGGDSSRRSLSERTFELHVVRSTDEGRTYEDTIDHLSESEREVTGLVFALAGYLVHEVYEEVPFILLDSLEAIDSDRIATLVEYFEEYASCLVIALLPEDASALSEDYHYVTHI